jgi:hypothetical protein
VAKSILLPTHAYCTVEIQLFVGISVVPLNRNRLSSRPSSGNPFLMLGFFAYYLFVLDFVLDDGSIPISHPDMHRDNMDGWGIKWKVPQVRARLLGANLGVNRSSNDNARRFS